MERTVQFEVAILKLMDPQSDRHHAQSIEHINQHIRDYSRRNGNKDKIRAGDSPFVPGIGGEASEHWAWDHFFRDTWRQGLSACEVFANARRQLAVARQTVFMCVGSGG